jgi:hypothetical protein
MKSGIPIVVAAAALIAADETSLDAHGGETT